MRELRLRLSPPAGAYSERDWLDNDSPLTRNPVASLALQRDDHVCQFCGFQSRKYQRWYGDEGAGADALATVCFFCLQVLRVDLVLVWKSAVLVWLPELDQAELNRAMPEIYVNRVSTRSNLGGRARELLDRMHARSAQAKARFGFDNPEDLVRRLRQDASAEADIDAMVADGLRLLPLDRRQVWSDGLEFNQFPQVLAFWRSADGPFAPGQTRSFEKLQLDLLMV